MQQDLFKVIHEGGIRLCRFAQRDQLISERCFGGIGLFSGAARQPICDMLIGAVRLVISHGEPPHLRDPGVLSGLAAPDGSTFLKPLHFYLAGDQFLLHSTRQRYA
jgi:hypothetical protein